MHMRMQSNLIITHTDMYTQTHTHTETCTDTHTYTPYTHTHHHHHPNTLTASPSVYDEPITAATSAHVSVKLLPHQHLYQ